MDTTTGLRERKKAATRQAVHEAALRLTVEHGFDKVTVEAIADAAGISRRTFSNYFSGKEDALLFGDERQTDLLLHTLRERPAGEPAWSALRSAARAMLSGKEATPLQREWAVRTRLAMRHPSLLARQLANRVALEREIAHALAGRPGTQSVTPEVFAAMFLTSLRLATTAWIVEEETRPLLDLLDHYLDQAARPFS
ncbi:TetR/AcrR family transcriptional regulator [Streptomyces hoynatensis]|uniref:TetR family transcriptional regulator n=1 Tax=Streptomyces hoynatensis TaxID=1141874 RepID=A0A3A9YRH3_9ACTN|nr:TetR family transcriptional regulator [Streptomyces hoynatensis]RKN38618.1 TetR family transcriptional regulator [Streptomyces hoynatensis]